MAGKTKWTSLLPHLESRKDEARRKGLIAAAQVLVNAVKKGLRGGYTTGDFVTGAAMNSVTRGEPVDENGVMTIRVGTSLMYPLFWELGHQNLYTGRYERVEVWVPAAAETRQEQKAAYNRVFVREMQR